MDPLTIWTLIKTFRKPILYVSLVLLSWGGLAYWGHTKYVAGKHEGEVIAQKANQALADERIAHNKDKLEWEAVSAKVKADNQTEIKRLQGIIDANKKKYDEENAKLQRKLDAKPAVIYKIFKPTDVITVPHRFSVLYNAAVADHYLSPAGSKGTDSIDQGGFSLDEKVDTYDATAFTEAVIGNIEKYNQESLACNTLRNIVDEATLHNPGT